MLRSALEAAKQEAKAFEAYGRAHETARPNIFFSDGKWRGVITDEMSSLCTGDSYAEVHSKLATWCRADGQVKLSEMHVGTCAHCKLAVTEADSWTHDGPDMGGYPPTVPVYHSTCKTEHLPP